MKLRELQQRYSTLRTKHAPWDAAYRDIAEHFMPTRYRNPYNGDSTRDNPMLNRAPVDSTGILALRTLAAGMQGGMTSPARPWFRLQMALPEANEAPGAREWLDEVLRRMREVFHRSNFYNSIYTVYGELGAFGTAFLFEFADQRSGIRFEPLTAGEYVLDTNAHNRVDTVFHSIRMTAKQIVEEFGEDKTPELIRRDLEKPGTVIQTWKVNHAVYPRRNRNALVTLDSREKPWASIYWLEFSDTGAASGQHLLRESGFDEFPGFGVRWDAIGEDVYGRSPAMDVLPDCRMLQQMGITTLKAIHKAVDPPMSVAAGLRAVGLDLTPGGINFVDSMPGQSPLAASPILQVRPDIQAARAAIQDVQSQIRTGLYNDLFRMVVGSDRRQITATEIDAKEEEKLILIGPVLERLHDELFIPLIDRTYSLMGRLDMLPPPPPELAGQGVKVEFVSLLAQAQKMVSTGAVSQIIGFVGQSAEAWPEALDAVNIDMTIDRYADYLGVETAILRSMEEREQVRQARAQAQAEAQQQAAAQQAMASVQGAADTARTLSETPVDQNGVSALEAVIGGVGAM